MVQPIRVLAAVVLVALAATAAFAQTSYRARLSMTPIANANAGATVKGIGAATATLKGTTLTITGTFEGLATPATTAKLHGGVKIGVRGPELANLQITQATSGTITGTVQLTKEQAQDLTQSKLYIHVASQKAPEGNLWGWLIAERK